MKVMILGASANKERYSYMALQSLERHGYEVVLVSPRYKKIDGHKVFDHIPKLKDIDTLTLYVNPKILEAYRDDIISLKPRRVIFNPGTESETLKKVFLEAGIETEYACTLVLLNTNQF